MGQAADEQGHNEMFDVLPRVTAGPVGNCWCFWGTAGLCKDLLITDGGSDLDQLRQMGPAWHQLALLDAQGPIWWHVVMFKIIFPCSSAFQLLLATS